MSSCTRSGKFCLARTTGNATSYLTQKYDYRLLKNRKSARKSRKRRKAELTTLKEELKALK